MNPLILLLTAALAAMALAGPARADSFTFGVTPQFERRQLFAIWTPILNELEKRTGHKFRLATAGNINEYERQYNDGGYDFTYMNPYLVVTNPQGYLPLLRDAAPIVGILVVRKESPIADVTGLDGAAIAFPAPNAIGASLLPRAELTRKFKIRFTPSYVKSHTSVYLSVAQGLAVAGGGVQKTLDEQKDAVRDSLRVIYRTEPVPSLPIAAHPRVAPPVREAVREALLALAATPEGAAYLKEVPINRLTTTSAKDYDPLRALGLQEFFVPEPQQ